MVTLFRPSLLRSASLAALVLCGSGMVPAQETARVESRTVKAPELQVPEGQTLQLSLDGKGNQVYLCQASEGVYQWKLKAPDADLFNAKGQRVVHHSAGPTWKADDGSEITGKVTGMTPSPDPSAIPWLRLAVTDHTGSGMFSGVLSVQRVDTRGGIAPSEGCDSGHSGVEVPVPYQALYLFYGNAKAVQTP